MSNFYGHPSVAASRFACTNQQPTSVNRAPNPLTSSYALTYDDQIGTTSPSLPIPEAPIAHFEQSESPASGALPPDGEGSNPAWIELKTKAGKDRKRLPLACIACRRKKIRCSGEKPACKHCVKSRIPCVYKVTVRKAAPRTDYMAMLDKRLRRMEERIIKIIPKERIDKLPSITRAVVKPTAALAQPKASHQRKRSASEAFNTESEPILASINKGSTEAVIQSGSFKTTPLDDNSLETDGSEYLPSKEIQEHLAEIYFDYVYGQSYYLLHKPSFFRKFQLGKVPPVLILAVCAVSARFSTHPQLHSEPAFLRGEPWAKPARDIALRRFDSPNITVLIVFLLLGLHEFGTCQGGRSWMYGGMAHRMAYALQLHKDLDYDPLLNGRTRDRAKLSPTDREIRRRTMWACFIMDRFNSSGTERPMFADERNLTVQLPIREDLFQLEVGDVTEQLDGTLATDSPEGPRTDHATARANMGVAAYNVRLVALWGRLIQYLNLGGRSNDEVRIWHSNSGYRELQKQIDAFRASLPDNLKYNKENLQNHATENSGNQFLYMHIAFNQVILFANRFSFPGMAQARVPKDVPFQFIADARKAALEAANLISVLIDEAINHRVVVPFAGYCTYLSSAVHIHGIFSRNPQLESKSKENLARNHRYMAKVKKYWGMFHFLSENLKELYRAHADAAARGLSSAVTTNVRGVFQYGDWYDRYPHGVSATDYEEPLAKIKGEGGDDAALSQKSDLQSVDEFFATLSPTARAKRVRGGGLRPGAAHTRAAPVVTSASPLRRAATTPSANVGRDDSSFGHVPALATPFGPPESYDRSQIHPLGAPPLPPPPARTGVSCLSMSPMTFSREMAQLHAQQQSSSQANLDDDTCVVGAPSPFGGSTTMDAIVGLTPGGLSDGTGNLWDIDLGLFGDDLSMNADPLSGAWFAPFNISLGNFGAEGADAGADAATVGSGTAAAVSMQGDGWYTTSEGSLRHVE